MPVMPRSSGTVSNPAEWTYQLPNVTDVDTVRLYLQDTDPAMPLLFDLEIQYIIDVWHPKYDSLVYCAAVAAELVATKFAGVVSVTADGVSVNVADISDRYAAAALRLYEIHKEHQVGGEVDITNLLWDQMPDLGIAPLSFGVGMHDNPEAGRQNYGSGRDVGVYEDTVRPGY
jgi:hypothetical protein